MIVRISKPARAEFEAAVAYLATDSPRAAARLRAAIEQAIDSLALFPNRGRKSPIEGLREIVVRGTPYAVAYSVGDDDVVVIRIRHTSRDPNP
ncbi:type II toxin-antitoxin system RelE/ParE family toxin [Phenylobacterium sp.]|uniref:type II toxin-antitoxin system RelE/ParE family toxin n=1 Tax=Phenylobacterium sp. TaxID=1871053 RepID=UPI0025FAB9B4|nr:type II toxin-antitoxin system RelE/ParE family toxin [Phenylobacterium sp.]MBX3486048.1 type II toxin-antitoxin system RelE/ParE family toxin [Phenylobacterium sp.]MCW5761118.1 type II toxin-antitoxin system RelE/ParE family toxin [Phenylobacterium sp.]